MNSNKELRQKYEEMLKERIARSQKDTEETYGTCEDFCPEFEKIERELKKDISVFESEVMVKKYQRSSAGRLRPLPEDIRPLPVLVKVMEHLFSLLERADQAHLFEVYKFVMDRSRAVRMDMAVQGLEDDQTIYELEKIARFHVVFIYLLFSEPHFELHLHLEQLKKIIVTLLDLYKKRKGRHNTPGNEEEFTSYFILLHLKDKDTFSYVQERFKKGNRQIDTSVDVYEMYQRNDFYSFLRAFLRLDFLSSCVVLASTRDLWSRIANSYKKSLVESIDRSFFERMLSTDGTKISEIMEAYGIPTTDGKLDFRDKKGLFKEGGHFSFNINLEHKRQKSIVGIIKHGPIDLLVRVLVIRSYVDTAILKDYPFNKSVLQNSFSLDTGVIKEIVKEYAVRILTSVKQKRSRAEQKKKRGSRKTDALSGSAYGGHKYGLHEKTQEKHRPEDVGSANRRHRLLVVHNKDIYSALFRQKLMKAYSNTLKPQFILVEKANVDLLLKFNLCIFCVDRENVEAIEKRFFMVNKIVDTAQGLEKKMQNTDEFLKLCHQRKIKKDRLFNVIDGKTPEEAAEIIIDLIQNNRNDNKTLEKNLLSIHNDHPLVDCDVYLVDDSEC